MILACITGACRLHALQVNNAAIDGTISEVGNPETFRQEVSWPVTSQHAFLKLSFSVHIYKEKRLNFTTRE